MPQELSDIFAAILPVYTATNVTTHMGNWANAAGHFSIGKGITGETYTRA